VPSWEADLSSGPGADGGAGRVAFWSVTLPCLLAFILLAAHAVRAGDWGVAAAWGVLAGLVCTRLAWARLVALAALFAGGLFWVSAGVDLVRFRMAFGMDWLRLAAIMAAVTGLTMAAWWRLAGEAGRLRHHRGAGTAWPMAVAFLLAAGLENLFVCGRKTARVFALLIVFGLAFWGAKNLSATALQCYRRDRPIQSALGPVSFKDKQQHQAVIDLKKYLENIGSNRYVLCYSYDMVIYHICDLKNPTRYPYIHPSIHTDRDVDIAIAEMEQHRVEYMIWGTKQGCRKMDDYIRHNFRKVAEFGQYRVWRKLSAIEEGAQL